MFNGGSVAVTQQSTDCGCGQRDDEVINPAICLTSANYSWHFHRALPDVSSPNSPSGHGHPSRAQTFVFLTARAFLLFYSLLMIYLLTSNITLAASFCISRLLIKTFINLFFFLGSQRTRFEVSRPWEDVRSTRTSTHRIIKVIHSTNCLIESQIKYTRKKLRFIFR